MHGSIHIQVTAHLGEISRCLTWHLPQVFAWYMPLINHIPYLLQMAEYAFFVQKADWWRKDMAPLWGNLNICPQLH